MNFYALSGLLNGVAATALGYFVFSQSPENPKHRTYGLYCLSIAVWSYFYSAWQLAYTHDLALLCTRLLMAGAIFIPITYLHHVLSLLDRVDQHQRLLTVGYWLSGFFLLTDLTPHFVANLEAELAFPYWPKPGLAFHFYLGWFIACVTYTTYLLGSAYRQAKGIRRNQYLYLTIASVIGYAGGATNFPLWYGIEIPPNGTILITVYVSLVAYTILRYRFLDFSVAIERGLTYLLLIALVVLPVYPLLLLAQRVYFGEVNASFSLVLLILVTFVVFMTYRMKIHAETAVARTLFKSRHDRYETLSSFSRALVTILDLKTLTEEIVQTLAHVLDVKTASLYLLEKEKNVYILASSYGQDGYEVNTTKLPVTEGLPAQLAIFQSILVREELEHSPDFEKMQSVVRALQTMEAEVCIPLINKNRLIGICNLGSRNTSHMFSDRDLGLLMTLGQAAAIALDNAALYEELKRSQILMRRTDRLRSLETIAGGFAHEIRNPLTSIKTFVELTPERKDDPDFIGHFSKVVSEDVARIERLIHEILDYARYMEPKFTEEDLNDIVESCLYFVRVNADSKSVRLEKDLVDDLPHVMLDRQQIKQVLLNLFLNAMDALGDGGGRLIVKTHRLTKPNGDSWVQVEVADTGCGIPAADLDHIFDPFYSTKHESEEREGTGLGLTIVHQIVQEHGGYIEVKSALGRGTTFFVNLPGNPCEVRAAHVGMSGS